MRSLALCLSTLWRSGRPAADLIFVGGDEALRDDEVRMAERLRAVDRDVELEAWPRMFHVWPMFARILPEGRAAIARIGAFLRAELSRRCHVNLDGAAFVPTSRFYASALAIDFHSAIALR